MEHNQLENIIQSRRTSSSEIINVDEPVVKLVIFELKNAWFAFPSVNVREILSEVEIFFVPGCPSTLKGVINVRGDIESVICLSELFGMSSVKNTASSTIILAQAEGMRSGLLVDKVVDVLDVVDSSIQPPPGTLPELMRRIVSGLIRHQDLSVAILNVNRIFDDYAHGLA